MDLKADLIAKLKQYGVGRRKLDDELFAKDKPPPRLGVYDIDDENLCHEVIKSTCNVPGCVFTSESLLDFENHYNAAHRYSCSQCRKMLPSPHLLDLHVQETHDSFFAVMAEKKPSYCCYIEECKEKFLKTEDRMKHCVNIHKLPKDFRFGPKNAKKVKNKKQNENTEMEVDKQSTSKQKFSLTNSRQRGFAKYTGKKFTKNQEEIQPSRDVDMDEIANELKRNMPE